MPTTMTRNMKTLLLWSPFLLSILVPTAADVPIPQVTIGISNNNLGYFGRGSLGGLEPALTWQTKGSFDNRFDWECGFDMQVEDMNTTPYSYWAKVKKTLKSGILLSVRGASKSTKSDLVNVELFAQGKTTSVQLTGTAGSKYKVGKINVRQAFKVGDSKVTVNPRYDVDSGLADVGATIAMGDTSVNVDSATTKLTLAQVMGKKTVFMPSITADGQWDVALQRTFKDVGRITASVKPNDSVSIKWEEGPWVANVNAPLDGYRPSVDGLDITFKRKL